MSAVKHLRDGTIVLNGKGAINYFNSFLGCPEEHLLDEPDPDDPPPATPCPRPPHDLVASLATTLTWNAGDERAVVLGAAAALEWPVTAYTIHPSHDRGGNTRHRPLPGPRWVAKQKAKPAALLAARGGG